MKEKKDSVYIKKQFNFRRIGLVHRHGCRDARHVITLPTVRETLRNEKLRSHRLRKLREQKDH